MLPLCKGELEGVEHMVYPPSPSLTKGGNEPWVGET